MSTENQAESQTPNKKETGAEKTAAKKTAAKRTTTAKKSASSSKAAGTKTATQRKSTAKSAAAAAPKAATKKTAKPKTTKPSAPKEADNKASEQADTIQNDGDVLQDLKDKDWASYLARGIFMLVFGFLAWLTISLSFLLAGMQFIVLILTGGPNETITRAIMTAGNYIADVMAYLSFKSDDRPFPLGKNLPVEN